MITTLLRSILAGICIALGGAIFLKLGGVIGAVMFAFGLLTIVHFKLPLYTGTAGFIKTNNIQEWMNMLLILFGNIIGCFMLSLLHINGINGSEIIQSRISNGLLNALLMAIGCGLIMTLIVRAAREKNIILILFGIPLFILLGFYHSIADAFYFAVSDFDFNYIPTYLVIVLGNFIGCNVPRILKY